MSIYADESTVVVRDFLSISESVMAPAASDLVCTDVLTFNYHNATLQDTLSSDVAALTCTFYMLAYTLIYDPNDTLVKYPSALNVSSASQEFLDAF